jgi:dolichol-phosphate mannosyltransferase
MISIGIVVPTYNESVNVLLLLKAILKETAELENVKFTVVIVDDNSPDGTSQIVKKIAKELNTSTFKIVVIDRVIKDGYGKACIEGMQYLLSKNVDFILSMDADLSHNPKYIKAIINASRNNDLVVGSRYVKGGSTPDWPLLRKVLSRYGNYYARAFLGSKISDYTGGFNLYSSELLRKINLDNIQSSGYGFLVELKYKASKKASNIHQVPIIFHDRQHGKSKIPKNTIVKNFLLVPKLKLNKLV